MELFSLDAFRNRNIIYYALIACLFLIISCNIFYKINLFPEAGGDEQDLISIDYRMVSFGERNDFIIISECYNQRGCQKLPSPWTCWIRSAYHRIIGWSPLLGRIFSALSILFCVLITSVLCPINSSLSKKEVIILLLLTGFSPSLYFSARTVRLEQEILLIGVISLFVIPLIMKPERSRNYILWSLCGLLSGWAAICHPGGMVFAGVQFFSILFFSNCWKKLDGLSFKIRIASWIAGVLIPFIIVFIVIRSDPLNWSIFSKDMFGRFLQVKEQLVNLWAPLWPYRAGSSPPVLAASLYAFGLTATSPWLNYPFAYILRIIFYFETVFLFFTGLIFLFLPCNEKNLHLRSIVGLAAGFFIMHFLYALRASPNYTYYPYLGLTVPLGFTWVSMEIARSFSHSKNILRRISSFMPLIIVFLSALLYIHCALFQYSWIKSMQKCLLSLDARFEAVYSMGKELKWSESDVPVYIDNMTWRAAGANWHSLFEALLSDRIIKLDNKARIAFQSDLFSSFLSYAGFGSTQLTETERMERLKSLFCDKVITGVLFDGNAYYCFYSPTFEKHGEKISVGKLQCDGKVLISYCDRKNSISLKTHGGIIRAKLDRSSYLLVLKSPLPTGEQIQISTGYERKNLKKINILPVNSVISRPYLVETEKSGTEFFLEIQSGNSHKSEDVSILLLPLSVWNKQE